MTVETAKFIGGLNPASPTGADAKSEGDDHLRLLKDCVQNTFPGFTGAVMVGGVSTGAANTYVLSPAKPLQAYTANTIVAWKPSAPNTGPATIDVSTLGMRNIVQSDGTALGAGDLGAYVLMIDTGTEFRLLGVPKSYVDRLAFSAALPAQPGGSTQFELVSQYGAATWQLRNALLRSARSGPVQLTAADQSSFIDITAGTFTQSFALPSLLMSGWSVRYRNNGTGDIELEAPAAVALTSGTITGFGSGTAWSVKAGLAIAPGDLVILRHAASPFVQRIIGTVASYAANSAQPIASITNSTTTATLTTTGAHGRTTGDTVTVAGAVPTAYNGTFVVTVLTATTLTYTMLTDPGGVATTAGTYTAGSTLNVTAGYRVDDSGIAPLAISTLNNAGVTATLTTAAPHGLVDGNYITVAGATPAAYNGLYRITVASPTAVNYTMASNPGGSATVLGSYTIQYNDWTITTRPPAMSIDGLASFIMYPGEERVFQCDGASIWTLIEKPFNRTFTASSLWIKPPGYYYIDTLVWAGGASGSKSTSTAAGGGGGACVPARLATASMPAAVPVAIGAGALGQTVNGSGNFGGNTLFGSAVASYSGSPGTNLGGGGGGGVLSAGLAGDPASGNGGAPAAIAGSGASAFGGGNGGFTQQLKGGDSAYGGGGGGINAGGNAFFGGGGGGGFNSGTFSGGTSVYGGTGGAAGDGANGGDGVAPGGGGGGTRNGTRSGNGARGEVRITGVA